MGCIVLVIGVTNDQGGWQTIGGGNGRSFGVVAVRFGAKVNKVRNEITLILRCSRTGTVWFYTSNSSKRAARPKLYTKSLTGDLKRMYSRLTLVRISIKL